MTGRTFLHKTFALAKDYAQALDIQMDSSSRIRSFQVKLISWTPPIDGWVKISSNGSVIQDIGEAAYGGIIRDCHGRFLFAYSSNLGSCSISFAELWGAFIGLKSTFQMGFKRIILDMDSKVAVPMPLEGVEERHPCFPLIRDM